MGALAKVRDDRNDVELRRQARERFAVASRIEAEYLRNLRYLTRQIDNIVKSMAPKGDLKNSEELQRVLQQYSKTIAPWAKSIADKMIYRIARKEESAWLRLSAEVGKNLRKEIQSAPTGRAFQAFQTEQVELIKSLPLEAAERVQKLTVESFMEAKRVPEIMRQVMETGKITENRAKLIARTETAKVSSGLTMVRAQHVGCTHYVWRTSGDPDVRPSHKAMSGQIIAFAEPPEVDPGKRYHAGQFPNCRCYISPIFPDID